MSSHNHRVMTASTNMRRATPEYFYNWLDGQLNFTIDVCADEHNHKHPRYFSERDNGLAQSWAGETFWMNPPYGRQTPQWMAKARDEVMHADAMGAILVPARVGTDWWRRYVLQHDGAAGKLRETRGHPTIPIVWYRWTSLTVGVYFHDERIEFDGLETGAPFDAAVILLSTSRRRVVRPRILSSLPGHREWPMIVEGM